MILTVVTSEEEEPDEYFPLKIPTKKSVSGRASPLDSISLDNA